MKSKLINLFQGQGNGAILIRGAVGSFIVKATGAGIILASQIIVARLLGAKSYGNYIYVLTWINLLVLGGKLGFDLTSLRFVASYSAQEEWSLLKGFLRYSTRVTWISSLIVAFCLAFGVWLLRDNLNLELLHSFLLASFILPFLSSLQVQQEKLRALGKTILAQIPQEVLLPLFLIIGLGIVANLPPTATVVMLVTSIANLIAFSIISFFLKQNLPKQLSQVQASFKASEWLGTGWSMILISGFGLIMTQIDIVMIGSLSGTTAAGMYAVARKISSLPSFFLAAVNSVLAPMIAGNLQSSRAELQRTVSLGVMVISLSSVIFAAVLVIWGKPILSLFGAEFSGAYLLLVILIIGQLVNAIAGPVGLLLNMTGHQNDVAKVLGVSAITNIALNAVVIPSYGAMGAAVATALTLLMWNAIMTIIVWRRLRIIAVAFPVRIKYEEKDT